MKSLVLTLAMLLGSTMVHAAASETVTLAGKPVRLFGKMPQVGDVAPVVKLISSDMKEVYVGGKTQHTQVLVVVPSIDTPICDLEARTFNTEAASMQNVHITVVSMDLPFAGKRYCAAHGIKNITVASDFQERAFGKRYGTLMDEGMLKGIQARVIFIIKDGKISYRQLVPEIKQKPDFEEVLKAI